MGNYLHAYKHQFSFFITLDTLLKAGGARTGANFMRNRAVCAVRLHKDFSSDSLLVEQQFRHEYNEMAVDFLKREGSTLRELISTRAMYIQSMKEVHGILGAEVLYLKHKLHCRGVIELYEQKQM